MWEEWGVGRGEGGKVLEGREGLAAPRSMDQVGTGGGGTRKEGRGLGGEMGRGWEGRD